MAERKDETAMQMLGRYLSLAFLIPVSTGIGYVLGYLLDKVFHTAFLKIVFLLAGIAAGFLELFRELSKDTKEP